jgi:hypothetical protein
MAFVPEGQADSSQARSAWLAMQRAPVPEGRSKSLSVPQQFFTTFFLLAPNLIQDRFNRPAGTGYFLMIPGTSCLATIVFSLRDKKTFRPYASAYGVETLSLYIISCAAEKASPDSANYTGRKPTLLP